MEFYLARNESRKLDMGTTNRQQLLSFRLTLPMIKDASLLVKNQILFDKFQKDFAKKFGADKEWTVALEFNLSETPGPSSRTSSSEDFRLKGELLKELQQYFHGINEHELLQVEVKADCFRIPDERQYCETRSYERLSFRAAHKPQLIGRIKTNDFTPRVEASGSIDHTWYVNRSVALPTLPRHVELTGDRWYWSVTIKIKVPPKAYICLDGILPMAEDTAREIFQTKKFPDFVIISEDGTHIPCHKVFLAKSPVLTQMLDGDYQEAKTNEMTMADMTTQGVNAFLEFLYCGSVNQAMTHCGIALELLKAADMYDQPILWNAMTSIISAKSHSWYDVDVALRLFVFVRQCARNESKSLMKKMIQVVGLKPEQLSRSTAFKELFPSQASQEMFLTALASSHP